MRIDVHSHYRSPRFMETLTQLGAFEEIEVYRMMKEQTLRPRDEATRRHDEDVSERIADMDAGGVDLQVLSLGGGQPYFPDAEKAVIASRVSNDDFSELMRQHPTRLNAFGTVPLPHVDETLAEIERCLDELSFLGINLGCSAEGITLDDARLAPVWEELDRRGAVVYIHPGASVGSITGAEQFHLGPDFVSPSEIAITAARLVVTGMLDRYPNVKIILATLGGALPFLAGRYDHGLRQEYPELHAELGGFPRNLRRFYYDTSVLEEPEALRLASERFGADRLMLGSDFPRDGSSATAAVSYVAESQYLDSDQKVAILDRNAEALLTGLLVSE
ncbi:amidohydrolase family protein [Microbacterium horticulturae]|uniref:Amidohydrolase family protein n=1 Tax=Microbacterium horticulturae TaxID=3028316 RepID=A0ABY8C0U3_9MICO|nr:amidohydrolase family protein [Microbacterium sp. KACC 23027]WEG08473.1 amidohydrolase family protein [Microbacterium sp. KACC 23027]